MPMTADLAARIIWKLEQAGYAVTIQPGHGYTITNSRGHTITPVTSLDELRALEDQLYELVWLGYRRVETA